MVVLLKNREGAIAPLCGGLLLVLAIAGFGIWGLLRAWRLKVETQFRLDHVVAREALTLKDSVLAAEASNARMTAIRAAAMAGGAALTPAALAAIRAELEAEMFIQEGIRTAWEAEQARWLLGGTISGAAPGSTKMKLAEWRRLPEDSLGPQPYTWSDADFELGVRSGSRAAAATITKQGDSDAANPSWHAQWTGFY